MGRLRGLSMAFGALAGRGRAVALTAMSALVLVLPATAALAASCAQLEASLGALDRGGGGGQAAQANQVRNDISRLTAQSRSMGCDAPRGFLIFQGPPRPPQCDQISDQISRLRSSLAGLERGGGDREGQRRALLLALAQGNCGPQYSGAVTAAAPAQPKPPRQRNFFETLFGLPAQEEPDAALAPNGDVLAPTEEPKSSYYRTVCVRTCDGYYFPISNGASPQRFQADEERCRRLCPATEAQLFAYPTSGSIKNASSVSGQPYMSLPNALRYRKEFVPSCSCRAPGQSWAQALAGLEDQSTLGKGDILVTEQQAREMSQPKFDDGKGGAGKGQPAVAGATQYEQPSLAATASAPLAPQSEQPGQRPVRIIPLPRSRATQQQPTLDTDDDAPAPDKPAAAAAAAAADE